MSAFAKSDVDVSGWNNLAAELSSIVPEDAREFLKTEVARLAEEIAMQLSGRKSLPKRNAMVDANIKRVFAPMPPAPFSRETQQGKGDVKWLYAGPTYLLGTKNENYQPGMSLGEMKKLLPVTDHHGKAYQDVGLIQLTKTHRRGLRKGMNKHQHVMLLNRFVVARKNYEALREYVRSRLGRLEASFAETSQKLRGKVTGKIKPFIRRHFPIKSNITNPQLGDKEKMFIEFGSSAPGVLKFTSFYQRALNLRAKKMAMRYRLIVSGYAEDVARSISPRRGAKSKGVIE